MCTEALTSQTGTGTYTSNAEAFNDNTAEALLV